MTLQEVQDLVTKTQQLAIPVYEAATPSGVSGAPWLTVAPGRLDAVRTIAGPSAYRAQKGVNTDLNSVYWIYIREQLVNGSLVIEPSNLGDHKVDARRMPIEPDYVYPLARGSDISQFRYAPEEQLYIVAPQVGIKARTPDQLIDEGLNGTLAYLQQRQIQERLAHRSTFRRYHARMKGAPVYSLFNIGPYTFESYKVVWREVQTSFSAAVLEPVVDKYLGRKTVVPDHKLMMIACASRDEAHYVCAILNAPRVQEFIKGYAIGTQVATHVTEYVRIPAFDAAISAMSELSNISKTIHGSITAKERDERYKANVARIDLLAGDVFAQVTRPAGRGRQGKKRPVKAGPQAGKDAEAAQLALLLPEGPTDEI